MTRRKISFIIYKTAAFFTLIFLFSCNSTARFGISELPTSNNGSSAPLETKTGLASYYADAFHGKKTANGEIYNMHDFTAAHPTYPFNTKIKVTNLKNNKTVFLRINDRMPPNNKGRIIDLSYKAAKELDMRIDGIVEVQIDVLEWGK